MLVTESQDFSQQISNILGSLDYKCKKLVTNTSKVTICRRNTNVISTEVDGNIDVGDGCWRQTVHGNADKFKILVTDSKH